MKAATCLLLLGFFASCLAANADIVVLRDGASYSGKYLAPGNGTLSFTDNQGIQYVIPVTDVQSIVFANGVDHLTLRSGRTYSGQLSAGDSLQFNGAGGIDYRFPFRDVSSLVITPSGSAGGQASRPAVVVPEGTEISIRTEDSIDSGRHSSGQLYPAIITQDIYDSAGTVAIPGGTPAQLVVTDVRRGGAIHSPELILDLYSVRLHDTDYRVDSSSVTESNRTGLGANQRTLESTGGGAALGALVGAVFGGGQGAGIGAAAGAGGGALMQLFTRGKQIKVPAETELTFSLERTLVLHP